MCRFDGLKVNKMISHLHVVFCLFCICALNIDPVFTQHHKTVDIKSWPFDINPSNYAFVTSPQDGQSERRVPAPSKVYKTSGGKMVAVYDDVLPLRVIVTMRLWIELNKDWRFHENTTYSPGNLQTIASDYKRGAPWTSSFNPRQFADFDAAKTYLSFVKNISNTQDEIVLSEATALVLRKGDMINIHQDSTHEGDYTFIAYLNDVWLKNDYGELMFYDDNQNIFATVTPKFNRVVIWDSSIEYLTRPPSMGCLQSQHLLMLRYTRNTVKVANSYTAYQLSMNELREARDGLFTGAMMDEVDEEIDVAKHVVQNYKSLAGKQLYVFDDLFPQWILESLRRFILDYGIFNFDDHLDEGSDNVQWIAAFDIEPFIKTRMWNVIKQVANYVSGTNDWFPYDIACNLIRSFDHTRIHEDCEDDEDEWTFLLYLNPEWDRNCQGETAYMETNGDDAEYITNVMPKYGRVVIFQGIIPHSARPPSSACQIPRLSFAVKVSVNEWVARKKALTQEFNHEEGLHMSTLGLLKSLQEENFEQLFQVHQREKKNDLIDLKASLISRYAKDEEENAMGDDTIEEEMDKQQFLVNQYKDFPEVLARKKYIYEGIVKAYPDTSALKEHFDQFTQQHKKAQVKYQELFADILSSK